MRVGDLNVYAALATVQRGMHTNTYAPRAYPGITHASIGL